VSPGSQERERGCCSSCELRRAGTGAHLVCASRVPSVHERALAALRGPERPVPASWLRATASAAEDVGTGHGAQEAGPEPDSARVLVRLLVAWVKLRAAAPMTISPAANTQYPGASVARVQLPRRRLRWPAGS
jgi:hypothetical protein